MTMTVPVSKLPVTGCTLGVISNAGFTQKSTKYTICTTKGTNVTMSSQKGIISIMKMAMTVSKLPDIVT